jgi:FixJ family two-component response regulator
MDSRPFLTGVVDDDPRVLESFEELLTSAGYRTLLFSSAEAFLEANGLQQVDCLISDIRMPGMNGWQLIQTVHKARPDLPVILMTARDEEQSRVQAQRNGARFFFRKPFDGRELIAALDRILRREEKDEK